MDSAGGDRPANVADLVGPLARRWWVVLLAVVLGTAAGWYAGDQQPRTYTSTTQVLVSPVATDARSGQPNLDTAAQLIKSAHIAERARALLGNPASAPDLSDRVAVRVPANTQVLEISFSASTPYRARRGAAAFAQAYLEQRAADAHADTDERITALSERIEHLREEEAPHQVIVNLEEERALLQAEPIRAGEVISPAATPSTPSSPNTHLYTLSGLVAGLLVGLSMALLIHRVDTRIVRAADLPEAFRSRVLVDPPGRSRPAVAAATTPPGRAFARLRNVLTARVGTGPQPGRNDAHVWLVCGTTAGGATGFAVANLTAALARAGGSVALIAGDPASSVFAALGVPAGVERALPDVFAGGVPAGKALVPAPAVPGVSVLAPGQGTAVDLPAAEVAGVVSQLAPEVDYVVVETPPVSVSADAQALSGIVSQVLLVVEKRRTRLARVAAAIHDFEQVRAPFAGLLLVSPPPRAPVRRLLPAPRPAWTRGHIGR